MKSALPDVRYVPTGVATAMLGVCSATLRTWGRKGFIDHYQSDGRRLYWDVEGYLAKRRALLRQREQRKATSESDRAGGAQPPTGPSHA